MGEKRSLWPSLPRMTQRLPHKQVGVGKTNSVFCEVSIIVGQAPTVNAHKNRQKKKKERGGWTEEEIHPRKRLGGGDLVPPLCLEEIAEAGSAQPSVRRE